MAVRPLRAAVETAAGLPGSENRVGCRCDVVKGGHGFHQECVLDEGEEEDLRNRRYALGSFEKVYSTHSTAKVFGIERAYRDHEAGVELEARDLISRF